MPAILVINTSSLAVPAIFDPWLSYVTKLRRHVYVGDGLILNFSILARLCFQITLNSMSGRPLLVIPSPADHASRHAQYVDETP